MIFSPLKSKLLRMGMHDLRASHIAQNKWTIRPEEDGFCLEAIFFPEDLSRITGYSGYSTEAQEKRRLVPHKFLRGATVACELTDAVLCGGNLYAGAFKYTMREDRKLLSHIKSEIEDGGVPCTSRFGAMYFGHWLAEDTALKLLAKSLGTATEIDYPQTPHQNSYNELFGIERHLLPEDAIVRKTLLVETDLCSSFRAEGWQMMKTKIDVAYPTEPHIGCMLLRGVTGTKRLLVNETEIAERLRSLGFRIADPATQSLDEILKLTNGSRMIVGVEGSQLAHGLTCLSEGDAMVSLQPPNRLGCMDKERCDQKKVRYALAIGHVEPDGFRIDIDNLLRLIDRVVSQLRPFSSAGLP